LGTLGDLGSHVIDMAHMLAGPIERVVSNRETFITQRPIQQPAPAHTMTGLRAASHLVR